KGDCVPLGPPPENHVSYEPNRNRNRARSNTAASAISPRGGGLFFCVVWRGSILACCFRRGWVCHFVRGLGGRRRRQHVRLLPQGRRQGHAALSRRQTVISKKTEIVSAVTARHAAVLAAA